MPEVNLKVVLLRYTPEPEGIVSHAARLCYSSATIDELNKKTGQKGQEEFIHKLYTIGHISPFEHTSFTFGVEGISRACSHQLVRHRLASYSQQSQRYVGKSSHGEEEVFDFIIPPSIKKAGKREWFIDKMKELQGWYNELVVALKDKAESPFEDARFVLPNAAETKIIITMNARELLHFFQLRCCNRAQWEIREMATEMLRIVRSVAPGIFRDAGPGCVRGKCPEGKMTCGKIKEVRARFKDLGYRV